MEDLKAFTETFNNLIHEEIIEIFSPFLMKLVLQQRMPGKWHFKFIYFSELTLLMMCGTGFDPALVGLMEVVNMEAILTEVVLIAVGGCDMLEEVMLAEDGDSYGLCKEVLLLNGTMISINHETFFQK